MFAGVHKLLRLTRKATPPKPDRPVLAGIPTPHPSDYMRDLWAHE